MGLIAAGNWRQDIYPQMTGQTILKINASLWALPPVRCTRSKDIYPQITPISADFHGLEYR